MFAARVLRLDVAGMPQQWIPWQQAATLYARNLIKWTSQQQLMELRGGYNRALGRQSRLTVHSIVACGGRYQAKSPLRSPLCNLALFRRDRYLCLYCGKRKGHKDLTCDHVIPRSRGGKNVWTNVVCACVRCNNYKGNRLLSECNLPLLALPYAPNRAEYLAMMNGHRILGDQMEFLQAQFSSVGKQQQLVINALSPSE